MAATEARSTARTQGQQGPRGRRSLHRGTLTSCSGRSGVHREPQGHRGSPPHRRRETGEPGPRTCWLGARSCSMLKVRSPAGSRAARTQTRRREGAPQQRRVPRGTGGWARQGRSWHAAEGGKVAAGRVDPLPAGAQHRAPGGWGMWRPAAARGGVQRGGGRRARHPGKSTCLRCLGLPPRGTPAAVLKDGEKALAEGREASWSRARGWSEAGKCP